MVTAVDVSPEALQQLRARLRESRIRTVTLLRRNVAKRLPFPNLSFDCVHAHLSLHFFDDRTAAKIIGEAWRVLRRGGIICVKCKSVHDQLYGKGTRVDNDMYYYGHTRHFFSKEYMKERLGRFHIVAMRASSSQYHGKLSAFIEAIAQKKL